MATRSILGDAATMSHLPIDYARPGAQTFDPASVTRPDRLLLRYYLIISAFGGPLFPLVFIPQLIRYKTLRYRFDEEGVSMSWGWVFRKETYLAYRRIQDIHVTRNLLHRWLGLSEVAIQTAAGSSAAEMKVEGILDPEGVRDFLYAKMRGIREPAAISTATPIATVNPAAPDELLTLLTEIRDALRENLRAKGGKL